MRPFGRICAMTAIVALSMITVALPQTFTIIHVNDTHSHLDAYGPRASSLEGTIGGIARAATVIMDARAGARNVLLLHGGDAFTGDLFFNMFLGVPEFTMLRRLGFDAMTVGNHELDLGADALLQVLNSADEQGGVPQMLSANISVPADHGLQVFLAPSMTKTFEGLKVGIFGLTIPDPLSRPAPLTVDENLVDIAAATVAALRAQGCAAIICMSHCGMKIDRQLAANVPGIDLIIGSHDHLVLSAPECIEHGESGTTYIVQAGAGYSHVGRMRLTYDYGYLRLDDYQLLPVNAAVEPYAPFQVAVDKLKIQIETVLPDFWYPAVTSTRVLIEETYDPDAGERDTPAGTLVTNAYLAAAPDADIAITALGLIADKLHPGPIIPADLFRVVGYGFDPATMKGLRLVTCRITGADLFKGLEVGVGSVEDGDEHVIQVGGMRFSFDSRRAPGERVLAETVVIDDQPLDVARSYTLVTNEAIIGLLDAYQIAVSDVVPGPFEYDALMNYVKMSEEVLPTVDGRMFDASHLSTVPTQQQGTLLLDCAPQPLRETATISFSLDHGATARVAVYDVLGRCVRVLADGWYDRGRHHLTLAQELPSGVYLLRMTSGGAEVVRRVAVVR